MLRSIQITSGTRTVIVNGVFNVTKSSHFQKIAIVRLEV